jgi:DNA-binding LytR/AlgR family response regulator
MLNVLVIDDEGPAHAVMTRLCATHADLRIVGHCYNAAEALAALQSLDVGLMLLDIRMPGFGGLGLLRELEVPPPTIIASAHRQHAFDGYELDVVDYLLKPVSAERFDAAIEKVRRRLYPGGNNTAGAVETIVLKIDEAERRFRLDEISHFEAHGNFVRLWHDAGWSVLATTTMRHLHGLLPDDRFVQVHKSFIVNCSKVIAQRSENLQMGIDAVIPIGRKFRPIRRLLT